MFTTSASRANRARTMAPGLSMPAPHVIIEDQKTANTAGGTATSGAWQTRTLNTLVRNDGPLVSLASNQFTLPRGKYFVNFSAPAYFVARHKAKIFNVTDAADAILGSSEFAEAAAGGSSTRSTGSAVLTLAGSRTFELRHQVQTTAATTGFGVASNFSVIEVYSRVEITKIP